MPTFSPSISAVDLKQLQFIKTIRLRGRNLNYIEVFDGVQDRIAKAKERGETELNLSFMTLTEWPESIFDLAELTSLDLSNNQLNTIPPNISQLKNLRTLILDNNPIHAVDENFRALTDLRALRMKACMLTSFPLAILDLRKLQSLALEGNQVKWIPPGLKDIESLEEIDLSNNPIMNLPKEFHVTTSARLHHYYKALDEEVEVEQPMILGIGFDAVDKIQPNLEDQLWGDFNPISGETVHFTGYMTKSLGNPDGVLLFNRLYQYLDHVKMLQISAPGAWTSLHDPEGIAQPFTKTDLAEIMSCLPARTPDTRILALHIENGWEMMEAFAADDFDVKLIRNWKMSLPPGARYIEVIKDLIDGTSIAYAISKILTDPTGAYIVASPPTDDSLSAISQSLAGTTPTQHMDMEDYSALYLLHLLSCRIPQSHIMDIGKKCMLTLTTKHEEVNPRKPANRGRVFHSRTLTTKHEEVNPRVNWDGLIKQVKRENKMNIFLKIITEIDPTLTSFVAPYVIPPS